GSRGVAEDEAAGEPGLDRDAPAEPEVRVVRPRRHDVAEAAAVGDKPVPGRRDAIGGVDVQRLVRYVDGKAVIVDLTAGVHTTADNDAAREPAGGVHPHSVPVALRQLRIAVLADKLLGV